MARVTPNTHWVFIPTMDDLSAPVTPQGSTCPRCGVCIADGNVYFAYRPTTPSDGKTLARKVCQWAYASDAKEGRISASSSSRPLDCINPVYDSSASYGPFDTSGIPDFPAIPPEEL